MIPFAFLFGLLWGSFLNVCIVRIPAEESIVKGRSRCPHCKNTISWFHNIPLLSYAWLKGVCFSCKKTISVQYPLIELVTGIFFTLLFFRFGPTVDFLAYALLTSILIVISVIDLYYQIIPDELNFFGMAAGFGFSFFLPITWWDSLGGIALGFCLFFLVAYLYEKWTGREGLGGGDVKMLGMMGAWLGYQSILVIIIISSLLGSLFGVLSLLFLRKSLKTAIPFGPFLAVGGFIYLFFSTQINEFLFPGFN